MTKTQVAQIVEATAGYGRALGLTGVLPGMKLLQRIVNTVVEQYELEAAAAIGQAEGEEMEEQLEALKVRPERRRGRPPITEARSGWPSDPEERSREMKRRQEVARANKLAKTTHAAKSAGAKNRWKNMTKKQQAEHLRKMQAGRKSSKTAPVGSFDRSVAAMRQTSEALEKTA